MMAGKLIFNCVNMHNGMMAAKSNSNVNFTKNMTDTKIIYFSTSWKEPKTDYVGQRASNSYNRGKFVDLCVSKKQ